MSSNEEWLIWCADSPPTQATVDAFCDAAAAHAVGDIGEARTSWAKLCFGTLVIHKDAPELTLDGTDLGRFPFPDDAIIDEDDASIRIDAPSLPAPPLALKTQHPVRNGFELHFEFQRPLEASEKEGLSEFFAHFETAYAAGDEDLATFLDSIEDESAAFRMTTERVEDAVARSHAYWLVELVDRFLPLARADFRGDAKKRRGLRPSWLGPVVMFGVSFAFARFAEGASAARGSLLALIFLPFVFSFLSRGYVSRGTWVAAIINGLGVAGVAAVVENPALLWPEPETVGDFAELQENLVFLVYGARALGLAWVIPYLRSGRG